MDGREGGYIMLHRRVESWPLWRAMPVTQRMVWITLLFAANWKDDVMWVGAQQVTVKRGQLAHAEAEIGRRAGVGRQVVRDALAKLERDGAVTRERLLPGNHSPWLVTIVNYDKFQGGDETENPRPQQPRTNREPSGNHRGTPREEGEEREEGKNLLPFVAKATAAGPEEPPLSPVPEPAAQPATAVDGETPATGLAGTALSSSLPMVQQADDHAGAFERIRTVWAQVCVPVGFAKAHATPQQCKAARQRMREPGWFAAFELACEYMAQEPFYRGGSTSGWVATLGWLLKPGNTEKTAERAATVRARSPQPNVHSPAKSEDFGDGGFVTVR